MTDDIINKAPDRPPAPDVTESRQASQSSAELKMEAVDRSADAVNPAVDAQNQSRGIVQGAPQASDGGGSGNSSNGKAGTCGSDGLGPAGNPARIESPQDQARTNERNLSNAEQGENQLSREANQPKNARREVNEFNNKDTDPSKSDSSASKSRDPEKQGGNKDTGSKTSGGRAADSGDDKKAGNNQADGGKKGARASADKTGGVEVPRVEIPRVVELEQKGMKDGLVETGADLAVGKGAEKAIALAAGELAAEALGGIAEVVKFQVEALGKLGETAANADSLVKQNLYVYAFARALTELTGPNAGRAAETYSQYRADAPTVAQIEKMHTPPARDLGASIDFQDKIEAAARRDALHTVEKAGPEWLNQFAAAHPDAVERYKTIASYLRSQN